MKYMVSSFIPAVKTAFKDGGFQETKDGVDEGGFFIVGFRGELYTIECDYQVSQIFQSYVALGCGAGLAKGSLHTTDSYEIPTEERLLLAMKAAEEFSAGVREPFNVLSSEE